MSLSTERAVSSPRFLVCSMAARPVAGSCVRASAAARGDDADERLVGIGRTRGVGVGATMRSLSVRSGGSQQPQRQQRLSRDRVGRRGGDSGEGRRTLRASTQEADEGRADSRLLRLTDRVLSQCLSRLQLTCSVLRCWTRVRRFAAQASEGGGPSSGMLSLSMPARSTRLLSPRRWSRHALLSQRRVTRSIAFPRVCDAAGRAGVDPTMLPVAYADTADVRLHCIPTRDHQYGTVASTRVPVFAGRSGGDQPFASARARGLGLSMAGVSSQSLALLAGKAVNAHTLLCRQPPIADAAPEAGWLFPPRSSRRTEAGLTDCQRMLAPALLPVGASPCVPGSAAAD